MLVVVVVAVTAVAQLLGCVTTVLAVVDGCGSRSRGCRRTGRGRGRIGTGVQRELRRIAGRGTRTDRRLLLLLVLRRLLAELLLLRQRRR